MDINHDIYEEKYVSYIIKYINIFLIKNYKNSYLKIGEDQIIFIVKENVF